MSGSVCAVEGGHGGGVGVVDVFAGDDFLDGQGDDLEVSGEGEVVDVPDVEGEFLLPGDGVAAVALGPAGDAGAHFVAAGLLGRVEGEVLNEQGAGADEGHVADEDVPELGQLVDGGGADEAAYAREALLVGQEAALGVALVAHGLEFHYAEDFGIFAGALLEEEGAGSLVGKVKPDGYYEQ